MYTSRSSRLSPLFRMALAAPSTCAASGADKSEGARVSGGSETRAAAAACLARRRTEVQRHTFLSHITLPCGPPAPPPSPPQTGCGQSRGSGRCHGHTPRAPRQWRRTRQRTRGWSPAQPGQRAEGLSKGHGRASSRGKRDKPSCRYAAWEGCWRERGKAALKQGAEGGCCMASGAALRGPRHLAREPAGRWQERTGAASFHHSA